MLSRKVVYRTINKTPALLFTQQIKFASLNRKQCRRLRLHKKTREKQCWKPWLNHGFIHASVGFVGGFLINSQSSTLLTFSCFSLAFAWLYAYVFNVCFPCVKSIDFGFRQKNVNISTLTWTLFFESISMKTRCCSWVSVFEWFRVG